MYNHFITPKICINCPKDGTEECTEDPTQCMADDESAYEDYAYEKMIDDRDERRVIP